MATDNSSKLGNTSNDPSNQFIMQPGQSYQVKDTSGRFNASISYDQGRADQGDGSGYLNITGINPDKVRIDGNSLGNQTSLSGPTSDLSSSSR